MMSWRYFPILYKNKEDEYMKYMIKMITFLLIDILIINVDRSSDLCADLSMQWYKTSAVGNIILIFLSVLLCSFGDELYAVYLGLVHYLFIMGTGVYGLFLIFDKIMPQVCKDITKKTNTAFAVICFLSLIRILETLRVSYILLKSRNFVQDTDAYFLV
jgi:hypothetical protein